MVALTTPGAEFGQAAIDFILPDSYGKNWDLAKLRGIKGLLIMFICNHCPYVQAILPRLITAVRELQELGINTVAIMANNWQEYPADAPEKMRELAEELQFPFPYLIDENQEVAKAYGAVCTPDFFGYNSELKLQYRGRFDSSGRNPATSETKSELLIALRQIAETGTCSHEQIPSIGCSIKWRDQN